MDKPGQWTKYDSPLGQMEAKLAEPAPAVTRALALERIEERFSNLELRLEEWFRAFDKRMNLLDQRITHVERILDITTG